MHAVLLVLPLAVVFPGVFLRGEMTTPSDMLVTTPPWQKYAPPDWRPVSNVLTGDAFALNCFYVVSQRALESGECAVAPTIVATSGLASVTSS